MSLRGAKRGSNRIIFFTLYYLLFTVLLGCGKNPVFNYLPEQKSVDIGGGGGADNPTLKFTVYTSPYQTSSGSLEIFSSTNPEFVWSWSGYTPEDNGNFWLDVYKKSPVELDVFYWSFKITSNIKSTNSVIYGIAPSGAISWIKARTLTSGIYDVRIMYNPPSTSIIQAEGHGTLIVK
jgi:hypothetical protein